LSFLLAVIDAIDFKLDAVLGELLYDVGVKPKLELRSYSGGLQSGDFRSVCVRIVGGAETDRCN